MAPLLRSMATLSLAVVSVIALSSELTSKEAAGQFFLITTSSEGRSGAAAPSGV
jgi:hypothetical protein